MKSLLVVLLCFSCMILSANADDKKWLDNFEEDTSDFSSTGSNTYFILNPGFQLVLEGYENGEKVVLIITVLDETKMIDNIETRVVEEREIRNGKLAEVSKNFFVFSKRTKNIYYFGEEVDIYSDGTIVSHEGSWVHGKNGAKYGLMMPGEISLGLRYYQEIAPNVAMDRAEIISATETIKTPAGTFKNCLKTQESSGLNPKQKEYKFYAPQIGLVKDGNLTLTKYGYVKELNKK